MLALSKPFAPPILKGIKLQPDNPFKFEFILDQGDYFPPVGKRSEGQVKQKSIHLDQENSLPLVGRVREGELKQQSILLIKYFLASLTIPEKDLWVNLSPYEKDRIVPESFGQTTMGRDLLAEDYLLKQITASLIYPESETGKKFWRRIYVEAAKKFGTSNVPVKTFNKVWIVPDKAVVYENVKAGTAYVIESRLKVMLEEDYLAMQKQLPVGADLASARINKFRQVRPLQTILPSLILREIVIPELTREVNQGRNFAQLRQIYNSLILAAWYKKRIKDSVLQQVYADKNKVAGVNIDDPREQQRIYRRYLQAFKKGVFNYIKETETPDGLSVPRKYFSGGVSLGEGRTSIAAELQITHIVRPAMMRDKNEWLVEESTSIAVDAAMGQMDGQNTGGTDERMYIEKFNKACAALGLSVYSWNHRYVDILGFHEGPNRLPKLFTVNNENAYTRSDGLSFHEGTWRTSFVRIGPLFFISSSNYKKLSEEIKDELRPDLMVLNDSMGDLVKNGLDYFNTSAIIGMLQHDFKGMEVIDSGAGDGILSLVALKLGAAFVDLIEKNQKKSAMALGNLRLNGIKDYEIHQGDLTDEAFRISVAQKINERMRHPGLKRAVLVSNIGYWPTGYGQITNVESLKFLELIPGIFLFIGAGHSVTKVDDNTKSLAGDKKMLRKHGFDQTLVEVRPVGSHLIVAMSAARVLSGKDDVAMMAHHAGLAMKSKPADTGGIDFTSSETFNIRSSGQSIRLRIDPAQLTRLQHAPGFEPEIVDIRPMNNLLGFLGAGNDFLVDDVKSLPYNH